MVQQYIEAAMPHGTYEILEDDGSNYGEISRGLVSRILKQAGISREDWERL